MSSLPLAAALERRSALLASTDTDCYRLVNGAGDGCPGFTVDRFAGVAVLSLYRDFEPAALQALTGALRRVLDPRALYLKQRPRGAQRAGTRAGEVAPEEPVWGEPQPELWVHERGLRFCIRPGQGLSVGLYLDARDARAAVEHEARGARVLNLFAYTCGFGVAALRGGAVRVLNVDLSRRVLAWGQENARGNEQPTVARDFWAEEGFEALRRLRKHEERFDLVVADPPSFSTSREGTFSVERDYRRLAAAAAAVIAPGGTLFALCNQASLTTAAFSAQVREGVADAGRTVAALEVSGASLVDFPPDPGAATGALKVLRLSLP